MMEITLKLSLDMVNVVLNSLGEAPYKMSYGVIAEIQSQAAGQVNQQKTQPEQPAQTPAA